MSITLINTSGTPMSARTAELNGTQTTICLLVLPPPSASLGATTQKARAGTHSRLQRLQGQDPEPTWEDAAWQ